ncbi:MAG: SsrA-binding protein [Gaiellaceae bacterium]|nr:SsrA-binding protein [Gaiellaceae bacterium]
MSSTGEKTIASNRRALHEYEVLERFEAGISLQGTEVKSLRLGRVSLAEAFAVVRDHEVYLVACTIEPYAQGNRANHAPARDRRLLLHAREIERLRQRTAEKGLAIIALRLYFKAGRVKVELALARGRNVVDKRHALAERDARRESERAVRRGDRE